MTMDFWFQSEEKIQTLHPFFTWRGKGASRCCSTSQLILNHELKVYKIRGRDPSPRNNWSRRSLRVGLMGVLWQPWVTCVSSGRDLACLRAHKLSTCPVTRLQRWIVKINWTGLLVINQLRMWRSLMVSQSTWRQQSLTCKLSLTS